MTSLAVNDITGSKWRLLSLTALKENCFTTAGSKSQLTLSIALNAKEKYSQQEVTPWETQMVVYLLKA